MISVLYFIRKINAQYNNKTNNIKNNGINILGWILDVPINFILAGWWRVDHHSTEYLIIAKSEPDPSGNDYTFFSAEARKKLTTGFIQEHLNTSNFCLEIIAKYNDNKKPNHFFYLLRANGFIKATDIEFKDLKLHSLENSLDLKILGNYANTIELN